MVEIKFPPMSGDRVGYKEDENGQITVEAFVTHPEERVDRLCQIRNPQVVEKVQHGGMVFSVWSGWIDPVGFGNPWGKSRTRVRGVVLSGYTPSHWVPVGKAYLIENQ